MVQSTELLEKCTAFLVRIIGKRGTGGIQIRGIKILLFRKRLIPADNVIVCRNLFNFGNDIFADGIACRKISGDLGTQFSTDLFGFGSIIDMVHHAQNNDSDQNVKQNIDGTSPVTEESGHFLFVRRTGSACTAGHPAAAVDEQTENSQCKIEEVEVTQFGHIIGIEEVFARRTVAHNRGNFFKPGEFDQTEDDKGSQKRIKQQSLQRIGNGDTQISAGTDN